MPQVSAGRQTQPPHYTLSRLVCSWEVGSWGATWVQVTGELDIATSPEFLHALRDARGGARDVVLDLRELCFIDSSGVHVIVDAARDARREGGRLLIVRGSSQVERVLTLTEVGKQVTILDLAPGEPAPVLLPVPPPGFAA